MKGQPTRAAPPSHALSASLRLLMVASVIVALAGAVVRCRATPSWRQLTIRESFEYGLGEWESGADVPQDGDQPGQSVEWSIDLVAEPSSEGKAAVRYFLDGKHDDGTIWLTRSFQVRGNQAYRVRLSFDLWSQSESFNTLAKVAAYAGPRRPVGEGSFDLAQAADQAAGWRRYAYEMNVLSGADGKVWVAFGISVVWETKVTYLVDNVLIEIKAQ
jgi:hypothetical protein